MNVGEACNREVVITWGDAPLLEAARLMREHHVGDIVIVEERAGERRPVGIVTDRDLVVEVLAADLDPSSLKVSDVLTAELVTAREEESLEDVVKRMRLHGVRRLPVVNRAGGLEGILALDDVLDLLAETLQDLASLVGKEQRREREARA